MALPYLPEGRLFTYDDYLTWPEDVRYELLDGVPYLMSPAPSRQHQEISARLLGEIYAFLKGKACRVYAGPFDVRLPNKNKAKNEIDTVVQPDITVICDPNKLDHRGAIGAPDWLIEIVSPSSAKHDHFRKLNLYETHGVREYWIVSPSDKLVFMYRLDPQTQKYAHPEVAGDDEIINPVIFESPINIDLLALFSD